MAHRRRDCGRSYRSDQFRQHLCYIEAQGFHLADERESPAQETQTRFRCDHCGRMARTAARLCIPVRRRDAESHSADAAEDKSLADPG